jgi:hypothetical protein
VNKPKRVRSLADLLGPVLVAAFKRQGFASTAIVTHWNDIVGAEIAAHAEPMKITWPRQVDEDDPEPATLVLRCQGPAAIEIQHLAGVIIERVNRFLGWRAIDRVALRAGGGPGRRPPAATRGARRRHSTPGRPAASPNR